MENIRWNPAAKLAAFVLTVISALVFIAGFTAMVIMDHAGYYQAGQQEMLEKGFENVCRWYSVTALSGYQEDFKEEELSLTNFRYGVIRSDDIGSVDLSDESSYLVKNFNGTKSLDALYVYECSLGENAWFAYGSNIWDEFSINEDIEPVYELHEYPLDGFYYDRFTESLEHYYVVSYVQMPLAGEQSFRNGDMFVQMKLLIDFVYRMRYLVIVVFMAAFLVFAVSFVYLMSAAGYHKGREKITPRFLDKLPLDLYLAGTVILETMLVYYVLFYATEALQMLRDGRGYISFGIAAIGAAAAGILIFTVFCMSLAVHVKSGKWWKHTLIFWSLKKIKKGVRGCLRYCVYIITNLAHSVTLLWKAWICLGVIAFVEYLAIISAGFYSGNFMFLWFMEKLILYPLIIFFLLQMNKLQKGAKQIAGGELDYRINTNRMFWEMKKHGEYLNDIGTGMNRAVNERLKSEHFKTELITNVSHDIKTPLTSIINYVDLLQKEKIDNPTVQDYLEVLRRQSARLKKLIEDLMEASKASTGNLSVIMEECDTGVMLIQTVGEFEEKLMENQIELQIKKPKESILIEADSRHLWRVFDNLMNNICKYAQPMTRAYVNLEQDGEQAVIIFRNISKCQLNISSEELMERFVRGDSSRNTEGSGLGISIAKSLTELMNGAFELVVDGDLFKVVLSFPLYGVPRPRQEKIHVEEKEGPSKAGVFEGLASGMQSAGTHAADIGRGAADKAGRMLRMAGRFVYHVKQAAREAKKEEEAAQAAKNNAVPEGGSGQETGEEV